MDIEEILDFGAEMANEDVDGEDVHKHATGIIASKATNLVRTEDNIQMRKEEKDVNEDTAKEALAKCLVDILLAMGNLQYEYGELPVVDEFEERRELVEDYHAFEAAVQEAESEEEMMEAIDDHMTEELEKQMGVPQIGGGVEAGDNVDDEDYESSDPNRPYQ